MTTHSPSPAPRKAPRPLPFHGLGFDMSPVHAQAIVLELTRWAHARTSNVAPFPSAS